MPRPKHLDNKDFKARPENINRKGQPPKILTGVNAELLKDGFAPVKARHIIDTFELLLGLTKSRLQELSNDSDQPILIQIISKQLLSNARSVDMIERMLDRAHGKAKQAISHESEGITINVIPRKAESDERDTI